MTTISAVIITKNEARNIGRCIDSLRPVADEIIVVDSFSEDDTANICREKRVHFEQRAWQGYAKTKNYANGLANHPYLLSIDADEALSEELQQSINAAQQRGLTGSYSFNRLTNYCGKWVRHSGWYPDKKTRLFPKGAGQWKGDFVHEELHFDTALHTQFLAGDLLHYSYYTVEEHHQRVERYSSLGAEKLHEKGRTGSVLKGTVSAMGRFITIYFLKLGFLDGIAGFRIARISAKAASLKYKKLRALNKQSANA